MNEYSFTFTKEEDGKFSLYIDHNVGTPTAPVIQHFTAISFKEVGLFAKTKPLLRVDQSDVEYLMSTLWDAGIRPTGHKDA